MKRKHDGGWEGGEVGKALALRTDSPPPPTEQRIQLRLAIHTLVLTPEAAESPLGLWLSYWLVACLRR